ncbi:hypothetical protein ILUMI_08893 [Ignelater luminosus]|uniref:Anoctamin n=1 Tax=Ignelater luminosus TaxID=2038154 RepID=A0A8K0GCZ6_IGNLU|nr:hypothetical protein ILUMI_08893 [Ignelater luminosus]
MDKSDSGFSINQENEQEDDNDLFKSFCKQSVSQLSADMDEQMETEMSVLDLETGWKISSLSERNKDPVETIINMDSILDDSYPVVHTSRSEFYVNATYNNLVVNSNLPQTSIGYKPLANIRQETQSKNLPKRYPKITMIEGTVNTSSEGYYTRSCLPTQIERVNYLSDMSSGADSSAAAMRCIKIHTDKLKDDSEKPKPTTSTYVSSQSLKTPTPPSLKKQLSSSSHSPQTETSLSLKRRILYASSVSPKRPLPFVFFYSDQAQAPPSPKRELAHESQLSEFHIQARGQEGYRDVNVRTSRKRPTHRQKARNSVPSEDILTEENPVNPFNYAIVYFTEDGTVPASIQYLLSSLKRNGVKAKSISGEKKYQNLVFVLLHMPMATLVREARKQKVPLSIMLEPESSESPPKRPSRFHWITTCFAKYREELVEEEEEEVKPSATSAEKIIFIHQKLNSAKFGREMDEYGIEKMTKRGIIKTAYPLHDADIQKSRSGSLSDRQTLASSWGRLPRFLFVQPLRLVNKYFGPEVAFYFSWMGYLACFLVPVSAMCGVFFSLALVTTEFSKVNVKGRQLCVMEGYMCPLCRNSSECPFSRISDSCFYGRVNHIFDNYFGQIVVMVMGIWSIIFTIYWKRTQNELKFQWNICRTDIDHFLRSEFVKQLKEWKIYKSSKTDPYMPWIPWCLLRIASMAAMIAMVAIICGIVLVIARIRISLMHALAPSTAKWGDERVSKISYGHYYSNVFCSILSAILIIITSKVLAFVVNWITLLESPRTQTDYNVSYISKLFPLECINNYGVAFYLAFFREFMAFDPISEWTYGGGHHTYNHMCDPSGCTADFSIHVAIVLVIKIAYNWLSCVYLIARHYKNKFFMGTATQWEADFQLVDVNYDLYVTTLYMEPVIKYGFMLTSVSVFYLGPIILLIDTVVTIRLHAEMFCRCLRRPVPHQVMDIGIWDTILLFVEFFGVIFMLQVHQFLSDSVGLYAYYKYQLTMDGYFKSTLSEFPVTSYTSLGDIRSSDFIAEKSYSQPRNNKQRICYFRGQFEPYTKKRKPYFYTKHWFAEMEHRLSLKFYYEVRSERQIL